MITDFVFLFNRRERPMGWKRIVVVWGKRCVQFIPLLSILLRSSLLRLRGARLGNLVILGKAKIVGRLSNLHVCDQVSLGRCEISLHDKVTIERCVVINDGAILLTASHSLSDPQWKHTKRPIFIGAYAWIATNSIILPGITIGRGAVIGAGSVVREDIPDFAVALGNPAVIVSTVRTKALQYSPVLFNAPFEAWVGRNIHNVAEEDS